MRAFFLGLSGVATFVACAHGVTTSGTTGGGAASTASASMSSASSTGTSASTSSSAVGSTAGSTSSTGGSGGAGSTSSTGGRGGVGSTSSTGGAGGFGGAGGVGGASVASSSSSNGMISCVKGMMNPDCKTCCRAKFPLEYHAFAGHLLKECGCASGAACANECAPGGNCVSQAVADDPATLCYGCLQGQYAMGASSTCVVAAALNDCAVDCSHFVGCAVGCL